MSVPYGVLYLNQKESDIMAGFLSLPPDFKAVQGQQFYLSMTGELEPVKLRANIEVLPQGSHIFPPPVCFLHKEGIFCHGVMSVKDKGI